VKKELNGLRPLTLSDRRIEMVTPDVLFSDIGMPDEAAAD
jgi:hypothetical protein